MTTTQPARSGNPPSVFGTIKTEPAVIRPVASAAGGGAHQGGGNSGSGGAMPPAAPPSSGGGSGNDGGNKNPPPPPPSDHPSGSGKEGQGHRSLLNPQAAEAILLQGQQEGHLLRLLFLSKINLQILIMLHIMLQMRYV